MTKCSWNPVVTRFWIRIKESRLKQLLTCPRNHPPADLWVVEQAETELNFRHVKPRTRPRVLITTSPPPAWSRARNITTETVWWIMDRCLRSPQVVPTRQSGVWSPTEIHSTRWITVIVSCCCYCRDRTNWLVSGLSVRHNWASANFSQSATQLTAKNNITVKVIFCFNVKFSFKSDL